MTLIIAGYTAAPAAWDNALIYYKRLATVKRGGGLELAWKDDGQTESNIEDLLKIVPDNWVFTLNAIPSTFQAWAKDHRFGLASPDETGRLAAVEMVRKIAATVRSVNAKAGRKVVLAVEIQPAPGFSERVYVADASAFAKSAQAVGAFDWDGAEVMIEHCDAFVEGQTPAKGFLKLEEEIDVLSKIPGTPIKLSLNWGRSLIEVREPAKVLDHVRKAAKSGLLRGFTLSGSSDKDNACGVAWADSHLAFADTPDSQYAEPASLMTLKLASDSLDEMQDLLFLAVKTNWPANRPDPEERARSVIANFEGVADLADRKNQLLKAA